MYSAATPAVLFDIRCEYEVPRYVDLNQTEDEDFDVAQLYQDIQYPFEAQRKHSTTGGARIYQLTQEEEFFQWF
jgi:hypothetical protein